MEHDLGSIVALGPHLGPDLEDGLVVLLVGKAVGGIDEDEVHSRGGELHGVLADDPLVIGSVVAEVRLGPVVGKAQRARLHDLDEILRAALGEGLGMVKDGIVGSAVVPQEVEDTHLLVGSGLGIVAADTALVVHSHPSVGQNVLGIHHIRILRCGLDGLGALRLQVGDVGISSVEVVEPDVGVAAGGNCDSLVGDGGGILPGAVHGDGGAVYLDHRDGHSLAAIVLGADRHGIAAHIVLHPEHPLGAEIDAQLRNAHVRGSGPLARADTDLLLAESDPDAALARGIRAGAA